MANLAPLRFFASAVLTFSFAVIHSQAPTEPVEYTVAVQYHITGAALRTTYRLESRVLVDQIPSSGIPPSANLAAPTRTLYFLDSGRSLTWEPANPEVACTRGSLRGDAWLDPFSGAADLATPAVIQLGSEVIHGISTKILRSAAKPGFKLWVDPKTGLMLKAEFKPPSSDKAITYFEVTEVHFEPPSAALFEIPARCRPDSKSSNTTVGSN